jgi:tRNA threonylcarbamoyladenosine biosynthesis protein TsaE
VQEAVDIGCEEYFQSGSICLIEWPEKILNLLPHPLVKIDIKVVNTQHRFNFFL